MFVDGIVDYCVDSYIGVCSELLFCVKKATRLTENEDKLFRDFQFATSLNGFGRKAFSKID